MAAAVVLLWMGALSVCDIRHRRLPNALTLPGAATILLAAALAGRGLPALAGSAALTGIYLLVHLTSPAAMGAGDVKLAIGLGGLAGCFGIEVWFLAALAAPLLTGVWGVVARLFGVATTATVPHGPSMCMATAAATALAAF
jgi:leader peptidase (prepilin peptidase) / N-methyltransferase